MILTERQSQLYDDLSRTYRNLISKDISKERSAITRVKRALSFDLGIVFGGGAALITEVLLFAQRPAVTEKESVYRALIIGATLLTSAGGMIVGENNFHNLQQSREHLRDLRIYLARDLNNQALVNAINLTV